MKKHKPDHREDRRHFFRKTAMLGAAALLGGAGGRRVRAAAPVPAEDPRTRGRYRLTAHIRRYYERASM